MYTTNPQINQGFFGDGRILSETNSDNQDFSLNHPLASKLLMYGLDANLILEASNHLGFFSSTKQVLARYMAQMLKAMEQKNKEREKYWFRECQMALHKLLNSLIESLPKPVVKTEHKKKSKYGDKPRGKGKRIVNTVGRQKIYNCLYFAGQNGASKQEIIKESGMTDEGVRTSLKVLEQKGMVYRKCNRGNYYLSYKGELWFKDLIAKSIQCVKQKLSGNTHCKDLVMRKEDALLIIETRQEVLKLLSEIGWHSSKAHLAVRWHNVFWLKEKIKEALANLEIKNTGGYLYKIIMVGVSNDHRIRKCVEKIENDIIRKHLMYAIEQEKCGMRQALWLIRAVAKMVRQGRDVQLQDIFGILNWIRKMIDKKRRAAIQLQ